MQKHADLYTDIHRQGMKPPDNTEGGGGGEVGLENFEVVYFLGTEPF